MVIWMMSIFYNKVHNKTNYFEIVVNPSFANIIENMKREMELPNPKGCKVGRTPPIQCIKVWIYHIISSEICIVKNIFLSVGCDKIHLTIILVTCTIL